VRASGVQGDDRKILGNHSEKLSLALRSISGEVSTV